MAYRQLEQYLGRGEEKVLWLLSYKHAGGGLLGGFLGRFMFNALGGGSVGWAAFGMVAGALVGVALLTQYHGVLMAYRLFLLARFYARRSRGARRVHAALVYEEVPTAPQIVRVRQRNGQALIVPRHREPTP